MAVQGSLNSALSKIIGLLEATFIVHVVGTLITLVLLLGFRLGEGGLSQILKVPSYLYLGGLLGVFIVYAVVASIPRLGVAVATTVIIVGQVATALLIDHFGLFGLKEVPFTWWKVLGLILLAAGAGIMLN
ncbi:MAG: Uncharacterized protein XD63_0600 [Thermoanaerobacterales bacterium 50_218]|nr:MAG: Uncharacterized protein XD63_0600 [Thermoanaerobacterales bacterium 50_218]